MEIKEFSMSKGNIPDEVCPTCKGKVIPLSNPCVNGGVMYCLECKEASPYGETTMMAMYKWENKKCRSCGGVTGIYTCSCDRNPSNNEKEN